MVIILSLESLQNICEIKYLSFETDAIGEIELYDGMNYLEISFLETQVVIFYHEKNKS